MRLNSWMLPVVGILLAGNAARLGAQQQPASVSPEGSAGRQHGPGTIRVTGTASTTVPADRATVSLAVESREKTAAGASKANAAAMSAVLAAVKGGKFEGLEIHTYGYSLSPIYTSATRQDGSRTERIDGYRAQNNVRVSSSDLGAVGRLIDAATAAGANRISGISFEASETEDARREVLAQAVHRAREQARTIATALDRELGPPLEVDGGAEVPPPRPVVFSAAVRAEAQTPIEPGDTTVSARVTITFALGPERASR